MNEERIEFGGPLPPVDRSLCASLVRGRDADGVLTQDVCSHHRREHGGKGRGCDRCSCQGFTTPRDVG